MQIFTFFRMFSRVYFQIFLKKMCFKILQRLKWNVWWYQWSNDNVLKIDLGKNALYISQKFHAHQILKTLFVKKSSLIPCGLISSIDCALLHAETKNTRENNGQFRYMLSYIVKWKNGLIWLNFKIWLGLHAAWRGGLNLDGPGRHFKVPKSFSELFGRFFYQTFSIGHLAGHLKLKKILVLHMKFKF